ncbi:MAG: hypothetical protein ACOZDD_15615 [Bacteroidota bacterium]
MKFSMNILRLFLFCSILLSTSSGLNAQNQVTVSIDAGTPLRPVSPWIYGKNNSLSKSASSPTTTLQLQRLRES